MQQQKIVSYRDLVVWQKSKDFVSKLYLLTQPFPKEEQFGLVAQMRRAAVSIPSNIAEGRGRRSRKDFVQFLHIASGSLAELETQLEISRDLGFIETTAYQESLDALGEIGRMLSSMRDKLKARS